MMDTTWEHELASLLTDLASVQDDLLEMLQAKCRMLLASDLEGMRAANDREQMLSARLHACHQRRSDLLDRASREGLPHDSIRELAGALPARSRQQVLDAVVQSTARARLLKHQSLTNWVVAQRGLIHLSQMLEIIATGGRGQPTYNKEPSAAARGALVDDAA